MDVADIAKNQEEYTPGYVKQNLPQEFKVLKFQDWNFQDIRYLQ